MNVIELFAGVGGFRVGLERASENYNIVWSNQWEPSTKVQHASDVYVNQFGRDNHSNEDIGLVKSDFIPNHDLLVGGFPCQSYSVANSRAEGMEGGKGILWWDIHRITKHKEPDFLFLENVDRLLKSPSTQRGKDFAVILGSLNNLGYDVEWMVVDASAYGMPQRRKRTFIFASKRGTKTSNLLEGLPEDVINNKMLLEKSFPKINIDKKEILSGKISSDLVKITKTFNKDNPSKNAFFEVGYMKDGKYFTSKFKPNYKGDYLYLKDILIDEKDVPKEFYVNKDDLKKWNYLKGAKSFDRVNKKTGHEYIYSEGKMAFPDYLDRASRTIITGEGGAAASRTKHIIEVNGKYRRLTPVELERLSMFPDNHTKGVLDTKRAFLIGNALVIGIVEQFGKTLLDFLDDKIV